MAYAVGLITAHYKLFPYYELRSVKMMVIDDTNANASSVEKSESYLSTKYLNKTSFFVEHRKDVDVVMLGDSITDSAEWGDLFPIASIANHGISGDTTLGVLNRVDLIFATKASKVFVMIGINDLINGKSSDEVYDNYQKIVSQLTRKNISTYIQSTLYLGKNKIDMNKKIADLNKRLEILADTNELISYIDLNSKLSNGSSLNSEYAYNGKTLNGIGYKVWRDAITPYVLLKCSKYCFNSAKS